MSDSLIYAKPLLNQETALREEILQENRRVHKKEGALYLARHPEQTNRIQKKRLKRNLKTLKSNLPANARILDLGAGTGYLTLPLIKMDFQVTSVDLSKEMLDSLEQNIPASPKTEWERIESDALSFLSKSENYYDAIVLSALLHHLYEVDEILSLVSKRLKKGGVIFIFFEPLKQKIKSPLRFFLHRALANLDEVFYKKAMKKKNIELMDEDYALSDYQRQFGGLDPLAIAQYLKKLDMDVVKIETYTARRHSLSSLVAEKILKTHNTFNLMAEKI